MGERIRSFGIGSLIALLVLIIAVVGGLFFGVDHWVAGFAAALALARLL